MRRLIRVHSLLLIGTLTSISFLASSALGEGLTKNTKNAAVTLRENYQKSLWELLFGKKTKPGGSRGDFCSIWPNRDDSDMLKIWSDRPVFVWEGIAKRITVHPANSEQVLWSYDVQPNERSVLYKGPALEPGRDYDYRVTFQTTINGVPSEKIAEPIPFQIMAAPERRRIATELAAIERQNQALSNEQIAQKRADYFAKQGLWSDVVREVFSIQNPSSDWKAAMQKVRTQLCPKR